MGTGPQEPFVLVKDFKSSAYDRAVFFYYAPWSGPAVAAFRLLQEHLVHSATPIPLFLINADEKDMPDSVVEIFGAVPHAGGEVCWIRGGRIVAQDILFRDRSRDAAVELVKARIAMMNGDDS